MLRENAGGTVSRLRASIAEALDPLLRDVRRAALLDFPDHGNVGDSAIWLGTVAYLDSRGIRRVRYTASWSTYRKADLARRLRPDDLILLQGGGNLGDLWEEPQRTREALIADFPTHRILQLPQSVFFRESRRRDQAAAVYRAHPRLTLVVRDGESLVRARRDLGLDAVLCPDMALCLPVDRLPRPAPQRPVVSLLRGDREAAGDGSDLCDWVAEEHAPARFRRRVARLLRRMNTSLGLRDAIARARLERGARYLGAGERVVTDRLHGHILCLLLEIPHVLRDDRFGKIRAFTETWATCSPLSRWESAPTRKREKGPDARP